MTDALARARRPACRTRRRRPPVTVGAAGPGPQPDHRPGRQAGGPPRSPGARRASSTARVDRAGAVEDVGALLAGDRGEHEHRAARHGSGRRPARRTPPAASVKPDLTPRRSPSRRRPTARSARAPSRRPAGVTAAGRRRRRTSGSRIAAAATSAGPPRSTRDCGIEAARRRRSGCACMPELRRPRRSSWRRRPRRVPATQAARTSARLLAECTSRPVEQLPLGQRLAHLDRHVRLVGADVGLVGRRIVGRASW